MTTNAQVVYSGPMSRAQYDAVPIIQASEPIHSGNTAVLSYAAYTPDIYQVTETFTRSARRRNIYIDWLSYKEPPYDRVYHKLQQFLRHVSRYQSKGYQYALILDPVNTVFRESLEAVCKYIQGIYEPNTTLYLQAQDNNLSPLHSGYFHKVIKDEGVPLDANMCFGSLCDIADTFAKAIEIQHELLHSAPRAGIAEYCLRDNAFSPDLLQCDWFLLLLTAIYYPERFAVDSASALFQHKDLSVDSVDALIMQSTDGRDGIHQWRNWCFEKRYI